MSRKIIAFVLLIVVALVVGLQFFLAYGLTDSLRKWVLPVVKERFNADLSVNSISVNLLGGTLSVNGIKLASGPGFDEPVMFAVERCGLKVGLPALFRAGSADIQKAVIKNANLNIVRNKAGVLNLEPVLEALRATPGGARAAAEPAPAAGGRDETPPQARDLPNIIIKKMESSARVNYRDWQIGQPFQLGLEIDLRLSNIANYGLDDSLSGVINLHGNLLENHKKCAFELNGRISPLVNPLLVSFDLSGAMQTADLKTFKGLTDSLGFQDGKISATANLVCRQGQFDPQKSIIRLKLSEITLTPEKAEKMKGIPLPSSFDVPVPVTGPLANPQIDIGAAFIKTITSEAMVDSIIKGLVDSKVAGGEKAKDGQPARKINDVKGMFDGLLGK